MKFQVRCWNYTPNVQVCKVTCCGLMNFQQHCNSKKHLRKTATAGSAAIPEASSPGSGEDADSQTQNPTYVGLQAQCRTYCKQVSDGCLISAGNILRLATSYSLQGLDTLMKQLHGRIEQTLEEEKFS